MDKPSYSQNGSSLAARLSTQWQQQTGRPASANDPEFAAWTPGAMAKLQADDKAALERSQRNWNRAKKAAYAAEALLAAGVVAPALAGGGAVTAGGGSSAAAPMGWAGVSGTTSGGAAAGGMWSGGAGVTAATDVARRGAGRFFNGDNVISMAQMAGGLYTGNRAATAQERANLAAIEESRRSSDALLAFNREEAEKRRKADELVEAEKKRQFDMTEVEKRRQWDAKQPWRDASLASLARLGQISGSAPAMTSYQPTFQYRP